MIYLLPHGDRNCEQHIARVHDSIVLDTPQVFH
jgi:hypothetical protein